MADQSYQNADIPNESIEENVFIKNNAGKDVKAEFKERRERYNAGALKRTVYWVDKINDDMSFAFHEMFIEKHKSRLQKYDIIQETSVPSRADIKDGKIIIVCRRSKSRLEHNLDYFLDDVDESLFNRVLVIMVHNKDSGENPRIPTINKIASLKRYEGLNNIIDASFKSRKIIDKLMDLICYCCCYFCCCCCLFCRNCRSCHSCRFCCRKPPTEILFGEEIFQMFLGHSIKNRRL